LADKIVVLKDGEVMQVGAPMDLFNQPDNEFVAGFLGSPKMNFFDGILGEIDTENKSGHFEGEGLNIAGVRLVSRDKTRGDKMRLGIRPQHLVLDEKGQLTGTITLIERLGTETVVELVTDAGTLFRYATPEAPEFATGDRAHFSFDASRGHLF